MSVVLGSINVKVKTKPMKLMYKWNGEQGKVKLIMAGAIHRQVMRKKYLFYAKDTWCAHKFRNFS